MFLVKKPKVSSFVLTESYFDGVTPLTIRFKLNSGICTDFIQVFIEKVSGSAILNTHYKIRPAEGLRIIKDPITQDLKNLSFIIDGRKLYFDLVLDPITNFSLSQDLGILFKTKRSNDYLVGNEFIEAVFKKSRRTIVSGISSIINSSNLRSLTRYYKNSNTIFTSEYDSLLDEDTMSIVRGNEVDLLKENESRLIQPYFNTDQIITDNLVISSYGSTPGFSEPYPTIEFTQASYSVQEAIGSNTPIATLSRTGGNLGSSSTVRLYVKSTGTAKLNQDYKLEGSSYIVFRSGVSTINVLGSIISDTIKENNESIILEIAPESYSVLGLQSQTAVIILDDD